MARERRWFTSERRLLLVASALVLTVCGVRRAGRREDAPVPAARPTVVGGGGDLMTAGWRVRRPDGAVRRIEVEPGALVLDVALDEQADEGEIFLDLDEDLAAVDKWLAEGRSLSFDVHHPPHFTGELQAFVKDRRGRSEYGSMRIVERHDVPRPATVALIPAAQTPAMGYRDDGFDPGAGIGQIGLKISAQSDRVRGAGFRPFRGIVRVAGIRIAEIVGPCVRPEPEVRPAAPAPRPPAAQTRADFLAGSGVDRPWPLGYAFAGPLTAAQEQELERTYAAMERHGFHFTRVYLGDYRDGLRLDHRGHAAGVRPEFLDFIDRLTGIANRHGVTVMFSLTDNVMLNGRRAGGIELLRRGEASEAFIDHVLGAFVRRLRGRKVIWDIFNEPENVTSVPLREVQRYVDRVLAGGRRADPDARFTVVSRSRPDLVYWQGRGLDLYSHNIFNERSLAESLASPPPGAPVIVAEIAPELVTGEKLEALRQAGYLGVGIWGWGTQDRYEWDEADLEEIIRPLVPPHRQSECM